MSKKNPITLTHEGETLTIQEWAERTGLTEAQINKRRFITNNSARILAPLKKSGRQRRAESREARIAHATLFSKETNVHKKIQVYDEPSLTRNAD